MKKEVSDTDRILNFKKIQLRANCLIARKNSNNTKIAKKIPK